MATNMIVWFEIPVSDMDRAKAFYEEVFQIEININNFGGNFCPFGPTASGLLTDNDRRKKHNEGGR